MTVKNLGYGGATNANYQTLQGLIAEFAPERFVTTTNTRSALLASGALQKEEAEGEELVIEAEVGSNPTTSWVIDFGRRAIGQTATPGKGRVVPSNVQATLSLGQTATFVKLSDERLTKLFDAKLNTVAKDVARHVCRGIFGTFVQPQAAATWSGTAADSTVTVPFLDVSLFKPNAAYDFVDLSSLKAYTVRCTSVTAAAVGANSANIAGNVAFINDVPNPVTGSVVALTDTAVATGDVFRLRGTTDGFGATVATVTTVTTGAAVNSFDDIAGTGATSTLIGIDPTVTPGWVGQNIALAAAYSQEAALQFAARLDAFGGENFTHAIMPPQIAAAHAIMSGNQGAVFGIALGQSNGTRNMGLDQSMDKYGKVLGGDKFVDTGLRLAGRPVIIDTNCPATAVIFHNTDSAKLAVWKEMGADEEAGSSILLNRSTYSVDVYFSGSVQLYPVNRSAIGMMTGVTGL
jgi:hypothetical protein